MENKIKLLTEQPLLFVLNEDCLLKIFEYLDFENSINFAESCTWVGWVADRTFKTKSTFVLDEKILHKKDEYIDRIFAHIGHLTSLTIKDSIQGKNSRLNLSKVISGCSNLKRLEMKYWRVDANQIDASVFDKVKLLTLYQCDLENLQIFRENFHKLKCLNIWNYYKVVCNEMLMTILQSNPEIESLLCLYKGFNFRLLESIPNVNRLGIKINTVDIPELNSLLQLNHLTKLRLDCDDHNINIALSELVKKDIMEEMQLYSVVLDNNFFDILKSFNRLQLLVIGSYPWKLQTTSVWPTNLKSLRLDGFEVTYGGLISTIQQLKSLERMDIQYCKIAEGDETYFKDVTKSSREILSVMDLCDKNQRLNIIWLQKVFGRDHPKNLYDSKHLSILHCNGKWNPLGIKIDFPGCDY